MSADTSWRELLLKDFKDTRDEARSWADYDERMRARVDAWASLIKGYEKRIEELEAFVRRLAAEDWRGNKPQHVIDAERLLPPEAER